MAEHALPSVYTNPITNQDADQSKMECFILPIQGKLIVLEDGFEYKGRLIIPEKAKRRGTTGRVVAVHPDDEHLGWLGKRVLYARFSGTSLTFKGQPAYRALAYEELIGELKDLKIELELDDTSLSAE